MTRAEEFDLAEAARERAAEIERRGAHAQFLAALNPYRFTNRRRRDDALNSAFERIRRGVAA